MSAWHHARCTSPVPGHVAMATVPALRTFENNQADVTLLLKIHVGLSLENAGSSTSHENIQCNTRMRLVGERHPC